MDRPWKLSTLDIYLLRFLTNILVEEDSDRLVDLGYIWLDLMDEFLLQILKLWGYICCSSHWFCYL